MNFLVNLNLNKNELQNAVIQPLSTAPSNAVQGQIYYNTVDLVLYQYDGTQWKQIGTTYVLPTATTTTLGGVIVGDGLSVDANGEISADSIAFSDLTSHPTTIAGYGITDASISGQAVTLGSNTVDVPSATTTTPSMDGTAAVGTETAFAKGDHVHPSDTSKLSLSGGTMTGNLAMGGNKVTGLGTPTADGDAATKKYADDLISGLGTVLNFKGTVATTANLPLTGNTKGDVYVVTADNSEWVWTLDAASGTIAGYEELGPTIDLSGYLETAGGTMSGNIAMGSNKITGLADGTSTNDAVNYGQLTGLIKTSTGTISTSQTSRAVAYTGTLISAYATMSGAVVQLDIAVGTSSVTFSTANNPSAAVTCTVVYV